MSFVKEKFPVTFAGFGLSNYSQHDALDGVAYQVTMLYNNKPFCLLYNNGDGGSTGILNTSEDFKELYKKIYSLLVRLNAVACKHLSIKKTFLYSLYVEDSCEPEVSYLEGLLELLYELNTVYAARKEKTTDSYVFVACGEGNMLVDSTDKSKTGGCGTRNTQTELLNLGIHYTGRVLYNYIIKVKAHTRVLHMTLQDMENAIILAKNINARVVNELKK